jgi:hypothetical protein
MKRLSDEDFAIRAVRFALGWPPPLPTTAEEWMADAAKFHEMRAEVKAKTASDRRERASAVRGKLPL